MFANCEPVLVIYGLYDCLVKSSYPGVLTPGLQENSNNYILATFITLISPFSPVEST